jgi:adenylate cyclase
MTPARRRRAIRLLTPPLIAFAVALLATTGLHAGVFQGFRQRAADGLFPTGVTDGRVAVVAIDERSLAAVGKPWPWPRSLHAELLDKLVDAGASVIVDDVVLAPPSAEDGAIVAAMSRGVPVVLASSASLAPDPDGLLLRTVARTDPGPELVEAAGGIASAAVTPDPDDGVVRTVPLVVENARGRFIPSLALAALMRLQHDDDIVLRKKAVVVGRTAVPTDTWHSLTVSFSSGVLEVADRVSAVDVLRGSQRTRSLRGKVVFLGATDPTLGDSHLVPPEKRGGIPGVVIHAAALNTMLTGGYLRTESPSGTAGWAAFGALVVAALVLNFGLVLAAIGVVVTAFAFLALVLLRFQHGVVTDPVYPPLAMLVAVIAALVVRYFAEQRRRRHIDALFSRYVPATVARQLVDDERLDGVVAGTRMDVTVLFCDLRGFTPLSASLEPTQVRELLDVYYEYTCSRILGRSGTIMQFVGDEVFATFGAPLASDDHPRSALEAALAIQRERPELDAQLEALGLPPVEFGIGVNTGPVVSAHVGPEHRRQYTVIGDTVNLGSRLCDQAAAHTAVVAMATVERAGTLSAAHDDLGVLPLKGVEGGLRAVRFGPAIPAL